MLVHLETCDLFKREQFTWYYLILGVLRCLLLTTLQSIDNYDGMV